MRKKGGGFSECFWGIAALSCAATSEVHVKIPCSKLAYRKPARISLCARSWDKCSFTKKFSSRAQ